MGKDSSGVWEVANKATQKNTPHKENRAKIWKFPLPNIANVLLNVLLKYDWNDDY